MAIAKTISSNTIFTPTASATRLCLGPPDYISRRYHKRRWLLSHSSRRLRHTPTQLGRGEPILIVTPDASPPAPAAASQAVPLLQNRTRHASADHRRSTLGFFVRVTPGNGFDIELKAHDVLVAHGAGMGGSEWFDVSPEIAVMGAAGTIGQKLLAISPNQIGQILQIAQGGGAPERGPLRRNLGLLITEAIVMIIMGT